MGLFRSIYISRVARQIRFADAEAIATDAAQKNRARDITGMLVYSPSHFIQVLEGEEAEVRAVLTRIRDDERHYEVKIIDGREIDAREFGDWSMVARRLSTAHRFDPEHVNLQSVLELLRRTRADAGAA